jgi:hypothetical protein
MPVTVDLNVILIEEEKTTRGDQEGYVELKKPQVSEWKRIYNIYLHLLLGI